MFMMIFWIPHICIVVSGKPAPKTARLMPVGTAGIGRFFFSKLNYGDFVNPINRNAKTIDKSNTIWYNGIQYQMVEMYTHSIGTKVRSD